VLAVVLNHAAEHVVGLIAARPRLVPAHFQEIAQVQPRLYQVIKLDKIILFHLAVDVGVLEPNRVNVRQL